MGKISRQQDISQALPTPSPPLTLCSVNNKIADLAWLCNSYSPAPVCPLGHELLLLCLSVSVVLEDYQQLLPRDNKHVCSPRGSFESSSSFSGRALSTPGSVNRASDKTIVKGKEAEAAWRGLHLSFHRIVDGSLTVGNCNREEPVYSIT